MKNEWLSGKLQTWSNRLNPYFGVKYSSDMYVQMRSHKDGTVVDNGAACKFCGGMTQTSNSVCGRCRT